MHTHTHILFAVMWCGINRQREIRALDRQRTQQQRPGSPTVTTPGMRVNTKVINEAQIHLTQFYPPCYHNAEPNTFA